MDIYIFAAFSGTGKTTYLEKLIPHLKGYGLQVAVLKHDAHDFAADTPGKDSWRFAQAGADAVAVSSDRRTAMFYQHSLSVEELLSRLPEVDIVLTEGYKHGPFPKIAVHRKEAGEALAADLSACIALVTDDGALAAAAPCPVFPLEDAEPLARLLLRRYEEGRT